MDVDAQDLRAQSASKLHIHLSTLTYVTYSYLQCMHACVYVRMYVHTHTSTQARHHCCSM